MQRAYRRTPRYLPLATLPAFDMTVLNEMDRFHLVLDVINRLPQMSAEGHLKQQLQDKLIEHKQYIRKHGEDMPEIRNWIWS